MDLPPPAPSVHKPARAGPVCGGDGPPFVQQTEEDHRDAGIEIWFEDEARFGLHGGVSRLWAETGTRPRALRQMEFEWMYAFAATCPATGESFALVLPDCDSLMMELFAAELSKRIGPGRHVILVLDNAPWHGAARFAGATNITLLHLPPYSPELNPVEQIWKHLRQNFLNNRVFKTLDAMVDHLCAAWRTLTMESLQELCGYDWVPKPKGAQ